VRLGSSVPFAQAATLLACFTHVTVGEATARRLTEQAGAAYVAVQTAAAERIAREAPPPPPGPPVLLLSADGAMVPLVGGEWGEVKTLAVGAVEPDPAAPGEARLRGLSYFSRRAEAETFVRLATVETHRRGVETAGLVALVVDGSPWCQQVADLHRPDAVRVLDFPHAVGYLAAAAQAAFGPGTERTGEWLGQQAHRLKHGAPRTVLRALGRLPVGEAADPAAATAARDAAAGYLTERWAQVQYARFRALGLPIASGAVESANKAVVEARLKGAGMHWAPAHVDPMVALRTVVCNDRWAEAWPQIARALRARARQRAQERRRARRPAPVVPAPVVPPGRPAPARRPEPAGRPKLVVNGRPTAAHPWKQALRVRRPPIAAAAPATEL
jgi:hypothetical protein